VHAAQHGQVHIPQDGGIRGARQAHRVPRRVLCSLQGVLLVCVTEAGVRGGGSRAQQSAGLVVGTRACFLCGRQVRLNATPVTW
jgi:hypothetical protein